VANVISVTVALVVADYSYVCVCVCGCGCGCGYGYGYSYHYGFGYGCNYGYVQRTSVIILVRTNSRHWYEPARDNRFEGILESNLRTFC
jgi:hypothetical protein